MAIPIIYVPHRQIGPLGLCLTSAEHDPGGAKENNLSFIPIIEPKRLDERELCSRLHEVIFDAAPAAPAGCPFYNAGHHRCHINSRRLQQVCALHLPPTSDLWRKATHWRRDAHGGFTYVGPAGEIVGQVCNLPPSEEDPHA